MAATEQPQPASADVGAPDRIDACLPPVPTLFLNSPFLHSSVVLGLDELVVYRRTRSSPLAKASADPRTLRLRQEAAEITTNVRTAIPLETRTREPGHL